MVARSGLSAVVVLFVVGLVAGLPDPFPKLVEVNFGAKQGLKCRTLYEDVGAKFGPRPDGLVWGWVRAGTNTPQASGGGREREDIGQGCLQRGLMHMQFNDCCAGSSMGYQGHMEWVFELPNGRYQITAVMGDRQKNSVHELREAISDTRILAPKSPDKLWRYYTGTAEVQVTMGKIRLSAERRGRNAKLNYVKIKTMVPLETGCVPMPSQFDGASISPFDCTLLKPDLPFSNRFNGMQAGFRDLSNKSNGFRVAIPSTRFSKKVKRNLFTVGSGFMDMLAVKGTWIGAKNNGKNAFGIGMNVPAQSIQMDVTVKVPATARVNNRKQEERFCLYLAVSDMEFAWVCIVKTADGYKAHAYYELGDEKVVSIWKSANVGGDRIVGLRMRIFPERDEVRTFIKSPGGSFKIVRAFNVNPLTLNKDQAGTDVRIGTRTYGGVIALKEDQRNATVKFRVRTFTLKNLKQEAELGSGIDKVDFRTWTIPGPRNNAGTEQIRNPTSMVWAGNRLFVAQVDGRVTSLKFNPSRSRLTGRAQFRPLGLVLMLGIAVDPRYGNNGNDCLWFSYSSADRNEGVANSGKVARVCGPDLNQVTVVIRGLPRAIFNHAVNNINFSPGRKLYINVGGNTAAGSPNTVVGSAFGTRPEQPLSAALLEAAVFASGFRGDCTPNQNPNVMDTTGVSTKQKPNCDVKLYASGLRNSFDCIWHTGRGGKVYCTDNAIGGGGTYPPQSGSRTSCDGIISNPNQIANLDPGVRKDSLYLVQQGAFYGHPNPSRGQCVPNAGNPTNGRDSLVPLLPIKDGKKESMEEPGLSVGTRPLGSYVKPLVSLGANKSANGIVVYNSSKMCGQLKNQLLITYFSVTPQVRRIKLNSTGRKVIDDGTLKKTSADAGGMELEKPLGIAVDGTGSIFVGQFGADKVSVFVPKSAICATRRTIASDGPARLIGAASASSGTDLFAFGGSSEAHIHRARNYRHAYKYNAGDDKWEDLEQLPEPISGAATLYLNKAVYIVGGADESGFLSSHVWKYDVETGEYERTSDLPSARAGAAAVNMNGKLAVLGGQTTSGVTDEVLLFENERWIKLPSMHEARSYAGAGILTPELPYMENDEIAKSAHLTNPVAMICGGSRDAEILKTCEQFDGTQWSSVSPMANARSHFAAFSVHGHIFVAKGGRTANETVAENIEIFDIKHGDWNDGGKMRVGRSQAIHGVLKGEMYLFSGDSRWDSTTQGDVTRVG